MSKAKAILVSTTHWDREWYWPLERFRFELVGVIDDLLETLERREDFHSFTFDGQSIVVEDYLEIRPEKRETLERLVRRGRLFFGPWYVQPDEFLVSGESLVRNFERGIRVASSFGGWLRLGYTPDMFGHIPQLPQILRLFGMDTAIMTRGMGSQLDGKPVQTEFTWQGLDGSCVRVLFQLHGYGNAANLGIGHVLRPGERVSPSSDTALAEIEREVAALFPLSPNGVVLLNNGTDHTGHQPEIPDLLSHVNRASKNAEVVHGSYMDYLAAVPHLPDRLALVSGELRGARYQPLLPGVLSSRVHLKQMNAACESMLCCVAEPLVLMAAFNQGRAEAVVPLGDERSRLFLDHAWKLLLQNHPHDSICGCSVDAVHEENEVRFAKVRQIAGALVDRAQRALGRVGELTADGGIAVFNPSGWSVPWPVTVDEVTFMHHPERGCGLSLHRVSPRAGAHPATDELVIHGATIENTFLRVSGESSKGPGVWLLDKTSGAQFGPLLHFESLIDAGDEYEFQPLSGSEARVVSDKPCPVGVRTGPTYAELELLSSLIVPEEIDPDREEGSSYTTNLTLLTTLRVFAGHPLVHVTTKVLNEASDHKMAVTFRMPGTMDRVTCGTQFGRTERHVSDKDLVTPIETIPPWYPFREYLVVEGKKASFALFARGLHEFGVLGKTRFGLTLWRSVGWLSRPDLEFRPGDAGPMMATPGAQCLRTMKFEYAFGVADKDMMLPGGLPVWQAANLFSNPPVGWAVSPERVKSGAPLPFLLHVETPEVVLSSVRPTNDGRSIRATFCNATNHAVSASIEAGFPFSSVSRTNFLSEPFMPDTLTRSGSTVSVPLGPFEIACLEYWP